MQVIRTLFWIALTIVMVAFIAINWIPVRLNVWPTGNDYYYVTWPVGLIVLVALAIGMAPMWLFHRAARWRMGRRISNLEGSLKAAAAPAPLGTSTQLDALSTKAADPS